MTADPAFWNGRYSGGFMGKRKESGFDILASMPWPACLAWGLAGFVGIQYGIGWLWGSSSHPFLSAFAKVASMGVYTPFAWLALVGCSVAATASYFGRRKRRHLLESQTGMDSLRDMDWQTFELLVGEAFRRQGYTVSETGQGGADGGIDLELRKDGRTTLVQCKQWRSQRVGVPTVREMYGVLVHRHAAALKMVALGGYTPDAMAFARGKPIELVDGSALLATVMGIQAKKKPDGALEKPLFFAGSVLACLLVALALPAHQPAFERYAKRPSDARTFDRSKRSRRAKRSGDSGSFLACPSRRIARSQGLQGRPAPVQRSAARLAEKESRCDEDSGEDHARTGSRADAISIDGCLGPSRPVRKITSASTSAIAGIAKTDAPTLAQPRLGPTAIRRLPPA